MNIICVYKQLEVGYNIEEAKLLILHVVAIVTVILLILLVVLNYHSLAKVMVLLL